MPTRSSITSRNRSRKEIIPTALPSWTRFPLHHPGIATPLSNLGALENRQGEFVLAQEICQRVLEFDESSLGSQHPDLGWSLICIADAQLGRENWDGAMETLSRADELLAAGNANSHLRAEAHFLRARALWAIGEKDKARRLASKSREGLTNADPSFSYRRKQIDEWLAGNG